MKWLSMSCHRYRTRISMLAFGTLPERERLEVERHAAECETCGESLAAARTIVAELTLIRRAAGELEPSHAFHDRWVGAVRDTGREACGAEPSLLAQCHALLSDLILPRPAAWGSLAVLWVMILYFNISSSKAITQAANAAPPTRSIASYLEQRRELARLLDFSGGQTVQAAPVPRPRTQRRTPTLLG